MRRSRFNRGSRPIRFAGFDGYRRRDGLRQKTPRCEQAKAKATNNATFLTGFDRIANGAEGFSDIEHAAIEGMELLGKAT